MAAAVLWQFVGELGSLASPMGPGLCWELRRGEEASRKAGWQGDSQLWSTFKLKLMIVSGQRLCCVSYSG